MPAQAVTSEQTAIRAQLEHDLEQLRRQITLLEQDYASFKKFMPKARRNNKIAICIALAVTVFAWVNNSSFWLRYYPLPAVLLCSGVFAIAAQWLEGWMERKINALVAVVKDAEQQLSALDNETAQVFLSTGK